MCVRLAALIAAIAALAVAGCRRDDGNGEQDAGAGKLSARAWSERVSDLCRENQRRARATVRDLEREAEDKSLDEREYTARVLDTSIETTRPLLDELTALPEPEGRERQADRFVELLRDTVPLFGRLSRAIRARDDKALEATNGRIRTLANESQRLARELGVATCIPRGAR